LPCSGAEEMPADGAKARWRGRHGQEVSAMESAVAEAVQRSAVTRAIVTLQWGDFLFSFFRTVGTNAWADKIRLLSYVTAHHRHRPDGRTSCT
jgi:hypothetical protein